MFWNKKSIELDLNNIPQHVGIIMDGNSRWAKAKHLPQKMGHREGVNRLEDVIKVALETGMESLTVYAFSTENWNRDADEVEYLMKAILEFERDHFEKMMERNVRIKMIGSRDSRVPQETLDSIERMEKATENKTALTFYVALNYGGQDEIARSVGKIVASGLKVTPENIGLNLDTDYERLDLLVRTSGEQRTSNFLLWQPAYVEFVFTKTLWPDFNETEFKKVLVEYQNRNRRFGAR